MKFWIIIPVFFFFNVALAQYPVGSEKSTLKTKEYSFGARMHTAGWAVFGEFGKNLSWDKQKLYQFEITEFKHPKQLKITYDPFNSSSTYSPFFYGKQNNFYAIHALMGRRQLIGEKASKSGVEVGYVYFYGASLGLLKPYYLNLVYELPSGNQSIPVAERYSEANAEKFLNPNEIAGHPGFAYGLGEIKPVPGLHGKIGLHFDWAGYDDVIKALQVGLAVDVYPKKIPIMIIEENNFLFANLYLSLQFGKKS